MNYSEEQIEFLKNMDFMRLGQAINRGQWQSAAMTVRRMDEKAKNVGLNGFEKNFAGIRQCINRREQQEAKQILAIVVSKRAGYLNDLSQNTR